MRQKQSNLCVTTAYFTDVFEVKSGGELHNEAELEIKQV